MEDKKIWSFFKKAKRKIIQNMLIENFIIFAIAGIVAGTAIHVAALFIPIYHSWYWAIGAIGVGVITGILYTLIKCPNDQKLAIIIDSKGLEEQLVTSMELKGKEDGISKLQKKKTVAAISEYAIKKSLPVRISYTNLILLFCAILAFGIAAILPSDAKEQAVAMHELNEVIKQEEKKVEEVKKEMQKLEELNQAELAELKKILEDSKKELKESKEKSELNKAKERMETKLKNELNKQDSEKNKKLSKMLEQKKLIKKTAEEKRQEKQQEDVKKELDKLQQQLSLSQEQNKAENKGEKENKGDGEKGENGNKGENEKNGEDSKNEEKGQQGSKGTNEELMEMAKELEQAVNNGELSEEQMQQLLEQLSQANNAMANNDVSMQSLKDLSDQMSQMMASSQAGANVSSQATASVQQTSSQKADGQSGKNQNGSGSGKGKGNGNGSGQGRGNGNGSGQGRGSGSGGGGGTGYNKGSKNGIEKDYVKNSSESVSIPKYEGNDDNLTGKGSKTGQSYSQKTQNGVTWAGNSVNYSQVIGNYANQAYSNVKNNKVPDSMKDVVKTYFEGLTN